MAVFDGNTRVRTRGRLNQDAWRPPMGALSPPEGNTEQALIHGDQKLDLEGGREEHVFRNHQSRTEGNYACHVVGYRRLGETGDFFHVTGGRQIRDVRGPSSISHIGPVIATYVGQMVEHHSQPRHLYEPITAMNFTQQHIHVSGTSFSLVGLATDCCGVHVQLHFISGGYRMLVWEGKLAEICEGKLKIHLPKFLFKTSAASIHLTPLHLSTGISASTLKFALNSVVM